MTSYFKKIIKEKELIIYINVLVMFYLVLNILYVIEIVHNIFF